MLLSSSYFNSHQFTQCLCTILQYNISRFLQVPILIDFSSGLLEKNSLHHMHLVDLLAHVQGLLSGDDNDRLEEILYRNNKNEIDPSSLAAPVCAHESAASPPSFGSELSSSASQSFSACIESRVVP